MTDLETELRAIIEAQDIRIQLLEHALKPFAHFAHQWNRQPMRGMDNVIYAIHTDTEYEAELKRSDCERARLLLGGSPLKAKVSP